MDVSDGGHQACDGLDFIVDHPEYVVKLATALNAIGPTAVRVKKQMFELLAALCAHNEDGRIRTLETLEYYKKLKNKKHRMAFIVQELEQARTPDYQTALVAFINCLIISTSNLLDRIRIRNEFIECQLLDIINRLKKSEPEPDLKAQLDVFNEQYKSDQSDQKFKGLDSNSPIDLFYAILKQITDTPQALSSFVNILQSILNIDPTDSLNELIWDNLEKAVAKATSLKEEPPRLSRLNSKSQLKLNCTCQQTLSSRRQSLQNALSPPAGPPPPPPPFPQGVPPPPPPLVAIPPPPPPNEVMEKNLGILPDKEPVIERLPQQEIPAPKSKMKTVNWNKIPSNKVVGTNNIWTQVAVRHQNSPLADIDWSEMEGLFCQQGPVGADGSSSECQENRSVKKPRKECQEIALLDGKRSLNVNIFLKQFRSSNEDIVKQIKNGEHEKIGIEKLKGLLKILPEVDELDMLKSFNGDTRKLGNAEKFLIQLTNLSNYKLRVESMLLKEEFESNMNYVKPSIRSMIMAAQELMTNKALQEVLYMILIAGNFLNAGGYAGNAAGVKLASLQKIMDIRANKPNMNLIHFVAAQAEKRGNILLTFTENIGILEEAAKTTVEQLKNEITVLEERIRKIKRQIELPDTEQEIKAQMSDFLMMADNDMANLQQDLVRLDTVRMQLAEFFCEDHASFKMEECFRIFHSFTCKFKQAVIENERRKLQEEQANARKRQREELLAAKRRQMENINASDDPFIDLQISKTYKPGGADSGTSEDEFYTISSPLLPRHRLSSFNSNGLEKDKESPESSPNGSLRRRRSKGMLDDQGNLMDFLRNSSDCSNRERKSWGSLDRSWARKAKRPGLFTTDFLFERDRTATPSPVVEVKGSCSAPEEDLRLKSSIISESGAPKSDQVKDKSAWRKSTLNVPNSSEEIRNSHRSYGGENGKIDILQPILETNDRKELIGSLGRNVETDKLTLYLRKPITETESGKREPLNNKIEIDQDNVQTPPMARKSFISPTEKREPLKPSPCKRILNKAAESEQENFETIGDFNRFSPARRTRRQVRVQPKNQLNLKILKDTNDGDEIVQPPSVGTSGALLGDFVSPVCIKVEPEEPLPIIEKSLTTDRFTPTKYISSRYPLPEPKVSDTIHSLDATPLIKSRSSPLSNTIPRKPVRATPAPKTIPPLKRTPSINSKNKISNSKSSESFKLLQVDNNGLSATKNVVKRSVSVATPQSKTRPVMGFMKPTTSSTTKSSTPSVRKSFSLRSRT
ncbi:hypothetical protein ABEB36_012506 [Hypothenemus hampei]|uniref:Inverted formin-2 n=1 Tax=Hypothenemus hampei TaxID=57062 RepID=A0ABD1EFS5_HYPHA